MSYPIKCPNCAKAYLEDHKRRPDLLICPVCWSKYDKEKALDREFVRVKIYKPLPRLRHKRGY
jgi:hypothetical protein